jgi:lysophospholipase L1-like esterase
LGITKNLSNPLAVGLPALGCLIAVGLFALGISLRHVSAEVSALVGEVRLIYPGDLGNRRIDVREAVIRSQIAQAKEPIIFMGDSITESALLPSSICGHDVINAGIGGAGVENLVDFAPDLLQRANFSLAAIAVGTNDSAAVRSRNFSEQYSRLLKIVGEHANRIVLVGVPPLGEGPLRMYFNSESVSANTAAIREIAAGRHLPFVDLSTIGFGKGDTIDGVHLSPGGYLRWRAAIFPVLDKEMGCNVLSGSPDAR